MTKLLYLRIRWLLYRQNIPYKFVKYEVDEHVRGLLDYNFHYITGMSTSDIVEHVRLYLLPKIRETKLVERRRFTERLYKKIKK